MTPDRIDFLADQAKYGPDFQHARDAVAAAIREAYAEAARVCRKRAEVRFNEEGTREHDTGDCYYEGAARDENNARDEEDESCAEAIEALAAALDQEGK